MNSAYTTLSSNFYASGNVENSWLYSDNHGTLTAVPDYVGLINTLLPERRGKKL